MGRKGKRRKQKRYGREGRSRYRPKLPPSSRSVLKNSKLAVADKPQPVMFLHKEDMANNSADLDWSHLRHLHRLERVR